MAGGSPYGARLGEQVRRVAEGGRRGGRGAGRSADRRGARAAAEAPEPGALAPPRPPGPGGRPLRPAAERPRTGARLPRRGDREARAGALSPSRVGTVAKGLFEPAGSIA